MGGDFFSGLIHPGTPFEKISLEPAVDSNPMLKVMNEDRLFYAVHLGVENVKAMVFRGRNRN